MTISLTGCAKTFPDGTRALLPTDLAVDDSEIVALLGPSGCGKTTLLRLIAGLETPDAGGRIQLGDDEVTTLPVEARRVGIVFQNYALFPNMSVRANIAYGLKMQKQPRATIAARVDEVMGLCRLEGLADRAITMLSGGQKQRVALARAVAPRPKLLLLDEPLSALDAALRETLRDELASLLRTIGTTAIFVTHDQSEALAIADRIAVMNTGRIEQIGTPMTLYQQPASPFVAGFVGHAVPLDGKAEGHEWVTSAGRFRTSAPAGDRKVFVRPESLMVDENGSLSATVAATTFMGTHHRVLVAGLNADPVPATYRGATPPQRGQTVRLAVSPDDALLL